MGKGYYSKGYYHDKGYGCCRICCLIAAQVAVSTYLFGFLRAAGGGVLIYLGYGDEGFLLRKLAAGDVVGMPQTPRPPVPSGPNPKPEA